MKKITALCVMILVTAAMNVQAQNAQHELSVSYGFLTSTNLNKDYGKALTGILSDAEKTYTGAINIQYIYCINDRWGLGLGLGYEHLTCKIEYNNDITESSGNFYTVMPMAKFNWNSGGMIQLYSKAAVGVCIGKTYSDIYKAYLTTDFDLAYHVSLIGLEVGKSVCGFAELGYGNQGMIQVGLKYRFR